MSNYIKIKCPFCGKWLLNAEKNAVGKIQPYCRSCKKTVFIKLPLKNG